MQIVSAWHSLVSSQQQRTRALHFTSVCSLLISLIVSALPRAILGSSFGLSFDDCCFVDLAWFHQGFDNISLCNMMFGSLWVMVVFALWHERILMNFPGSVDDGLRNGSLHFDAVPDFFFYLYMQDEKSQNFFDP